jgi:hypothetical protein
LWILLHDSGNPECRAGIADARWHENPHVHVVDLDFVSGGLAGPGEFRDMIWGGLAIALLLPEPRTGGLQVAASAAHTQAALYRASIHYPSFANSVRRFLRTKGKGLTRRLAATRRPQP